MPMTLMGPPLRVKLVKAFYAEITRLKLCKQPPT